MTLTTQQVKNRIDQIIAGYQAAVGVPTASVVPPALTAGKLYEAWVLCSVLERLRVDEGFAVQLRQSSKVTLKSSPGPINRAYPYFELISSQGRPAIEVWTDVEFLTLSYARRSGRSTPRPGDYHELDIVAVPIGTMARPANDEILLGVECKNTGYTKELLRGILGVRRELSLLRDPMPTHFAKWPRSMAPADPASCLMVYSTDKQVVNYVDPGDVFGIDFVHDALP